MQVLSDFWVAEFLYSEYNDLKKNQTTVFWYSFIQNYQVKKISYLESLFILKKFTRSPKTSDGSETGIHFWSSLWWNWSQMKSESIFRKWINLVQIPTTIVKYLVLLWIKYSFPGLDQKILYFCY